PMTTIGGLLKEWDFVRAISISSPIRSSRKFIRSMCLGKIDHLQRRFLNLSSHEPVRNPGSALSILAVLSVHDIYAIFQDLANADIAALRSFPKALRDLSPIDFRPVLV